MVDIVELNKLVLAEGCELDDLVVAKSLDELNELVKLDNQLEVGDRY